MKIKVIICCVAIMVFALCVSGVAAGVDFSGTWALDKGRSEGLPPGMDQAMTITQKGDRIDLETKVVGGAGEQTVKDSYILDGKETEFTPPVLGEGKGKSGRRTSKWGTEGNGFDVSEAATIDGPQGEATIKATRRWLLSADGKTLTIEMSFDGPNGMMNTKRIFVRK